VRPCSFMTGGELRAGLPSLGLEATVKVCGVAVAMPQGQEPGASPVDRMTVNVGTACVVPCLLRAQRGGGDRPGAG
jgi:hypothetical protein